MIYTDLTTIGGRVWAIRANENLSRRAFAERLGCQQIEIENIEYNKLKKPEQKESLYRNIAATFGVSLDWIKTGEGEMYGPEPRDRDALYERGIRQRNLTICILLGFLAFLGVAFVAYVALDISDPQHGFIRSGQPFHWLAIVLPLGLSALVAGHMRLSRRIRRTKKEIPEPELDTEK